MDLRHVIPMKPIDFIDKTLTDLLNDIPCSIRLYFDDTGETYVSLYDILTSKYTESMAIKLMKDYPNEVVEKSAQYIYIHHIDVNKRYMHECYGLGKITMINSANLKSNANMTLTL